MIHCKVCKSTSFRRTGIEKSDKPMLFLLRYPVRCRTCGHRKRVSIFAAFFTALSRNAPHKGNIGQTWTEFTTESNPK
jgi:hypothetical protein